VTPLPRGPFRTITADPPWCYSDRVHAARVRGVKVAAYGFGADKIRGRRGAEGYYPTMTIDEIAALPVLASAAIDAHLYLWCTNAFIEPAHTVARAWGFEPRTILTWVKPGIGMGHFFRNNTEHVIFAARGRLSVARRDCPTAFTAPRTKTHSEKPSQFFEIVESMSPGPYLEIFARTCRAGWSAWGNQLDTDRSRSEVAL
jgi:N6-adenosine-specific RNA methylase IME4